MSEETVAQSTAQAEITIKPLSDNAFIAFFQKIARWWLGLWYGFADKHPKGSSIIYKVFFFIVFSEGVTIWQFVVMTFLPYALAGLGTDAWGWPNIVLDFASNNGATFLIFGDTNGLGYFVAFEIATFTAQCINFPLQRNITYKSKGNPVFQAMWYFIGWVIISVLINIIWGFINCFLTSWGWYLEGAEGLATIAGLLKTVLTGGVSMVVFFFIFMIVFPDQQKAAATAQKKVDALKEQNASEEAIAQAEAKAVDLAEKARLDTTRRDEISARSLANAKAVSWDASKKLLEKMKAQGKTEEELATQEKIVEGKYQEALETAVKRDEAIAANETAIAEVEAARAARA